MQQVRWTRRRFLALSGAALLAQLGVARKAVGQGVFTEPMRVGVVLPEPTGATELEHVLSDAVSRSAERGAQMASDEIGFNAEMLGMDFRAVTITVPDAAAARQAVHRLVREEGVYAIVGGFGDEQARALMRAAADQGVVFFNIGSASDALRGAECHPNTFHVEASAAMYLDALAGWLVRAAHRRWFLVHEDSDEGRMLYRRARKAITERHFGVREVGRSAVEPYQADYGTVFDSIQRANPDVVVLLTSAGDQLSFVQQYDATGLSARVTGFPHPATQTRLFFRILQERAQRVDAGYRATLWETTLDRYGARELNARFIEQWRAPMDPPAWAAYASLKILFESAMFGGATAVDSLRRYLESPHAVFDVWKGIGTSFRPWDHQLRQSLYLVRVDQERELGHAVRDEVELASLVGELPAIYMPGTDPVERLDQLGDLQNDSACRFSRAN
ncbi:MAG: ABC transporter substrate-binding protein [Firmicutes bacterium]|nr:ABC transporter substrate-binding protein [Bacillota bacterium]